MDALCRGGLDALCRVIGWIRKVGVVEWMR